MLLPKAVGEDTTDGNRATCVGAYGCLRLLANCYTGPSGLNAMSGTKAMWRGALSMTRGQDGSAIVRAARKLNHSDPWAGPAVDYSRRKRAASRPEEIVCTGIDDVPPAAS